MTVYEKMTALADAIREKTGGTEKLSIDQMTADVKAFQAGGSSVPTKEVNFYDYDGTVLHAYSVEEAQALTELPALPERDGLICQGWNYDLETIKAYNCAVNVGATYITDDGKTRLYIHLEEGRTSPVLGIGVKGTVTVDWGDGTTPEVLTGTSTSTVVYTANHEYAKPGDYVVRLTVEGNMGAVQCMAVNGSDNRNKAYQNAVQRIEIGHGVTSIGGFSEYYSLSSITIPNSVTSMGRSAFSSCYSLSYLTIPDSVTSLDDYTFSSCTSLSTVSVPDGVPYMWYGAFQKCSSLSSITIPSATSVGSTAFSNCNSLRSITIPQGVTSIGQNSFASCYSLSSITVPSSVTSISGNGFASCYGVRYYDFSKHTVVPTMLNATAFSSIASDCEIRVPAALYDEWIAETNWATYASNIVAV